MSDTLIIGGTTYSGVAGIKAADSSDNELTFIRPTGTKQISITENGTTTEDVAAYANAEITVNVQGGGLPVSVLNHETVTPASDITKDNRLSLSLTPVTNYVLLYFSDDDIPAGASTRGIAACRIKIGSDNVAQSGVIRRTDGTQGTDAAALSGFTESTGVLLFPSTQGYSNLVAGKTYEFWLFEIGGFA